MIVQPSPQTFSEMNGLPVLIQFATILSCSDKFTGHITLRNMFMAATKNRLPE